MNFKSPCAHVQQQEKECFDIIKGKKALRPHHGMCIQFYEGKGYGEEFTDHMARVIYDMEKNPLREIVLTDGVDTVCENCPNNKEGMCVDNDKVARYDAGVLEACGMNNGDIIQYAIFIAFVKEKVIDSGIRKNICGDCEWNYICERKDRL